MTKYKIEEYRKSILNCLLCGQCNTRYDSFSARRVCPPGENSLGFETTRPRGKMIIARGILEGEIIYSTAIAEALTWCTTCGNCVQQCGAVSMETALPVFVIPEIVEAMRADLVDLGIAPEHYKALALRIEKLKNSYGEPKENRTKWTEGLKVSFVEAKKQ